MTMNNILEYSACFFIGLFIRGLIKETKQIIDEDVNIVINLCHQGRYDELSNFLKNKYQIHFDTIKFKETLKSFVNIKETNLFQDLSDSKIYLNQKEEIVFDNSISELIKNSLVQFINNNISVLRPPKYQIFYEKWNTILLNKNVTQVQDALGGDFVKKSVHNGEIVKLQNEIAKLKTDHAQLIINLKAEHESSINTLKGLHADSIKTLKGSHEDIVKKKDNEYQILVGKIEKLNVDYKTLESQHQVATNDNINTTKFIQNVDNLAKNWKLGQDTILNNTFNSIKTFVDKTLNDNLITWKTNPDKTNDYHKVFDEINNFKLDEKIKASFLNYQKTPNTNSVFNSISTDIINNLFTDPKTKSTIKDKHKSIFKIYKETIENNLKNNIKNQDDYLTNFLTQTIEKVKKLPKNATLTNGEKCEKLLIAMLNSFIADGILVYMQNYLYPPNHDIIPSYNVSNLQLLNSFLDEIQKAYTTCVNDSKQKDDTINAQQSTIENLRAETSKDGAITIKKNYISSFFAHYNLNLNIETSDRKLIVDKVLEINNPFISKIELENNISNLNPFEFVEFLYNLIRDTQNESNRT